MNPFRVVGLALLLTVWWITPAAVAQSAGSLDITFADPKINGGAVITPQPDGKLVVSGGSLYLSAPFTFLNAVRLNDDGTVDPTFNAPGNAVLGHALLPDGRIFVFGNFTTLGTLATRNLAILKADGSPDPGFVAGTLAANNPPTFAVPVPDGSGVYVGYYGGYLQRINLNGTTNDAFIAASLDTGNILGLALQPSGKLLVFQSGKILRLNPDGSRDAGYVETTFPITAPKLAQAPDGSLFVGGATAKVNNGDFRTLFKLLPDGGLDPAFKFVGDGKSAGDKTISGLARQPDGKLLYSIAGSTLARLLPTGSADSPLAASIYPGIFALDNASRIIATGTYIQFAPTVVVRSGLFRLLSGTPTKPVITSSPSTVTARSGAIANFEVSVSGAEPFSYQWQFNNANVTDATNRLYSLSPARRANEGNYRVIIGNAIGAVTSAPIALTVLAEPFINTSPVAHTVISGEATSFSVSAFGEEPLAYQWQFKEVNLSGATDRTLPLSPALSGNAGSYRVVVGNAFGSVTSAPAALTVIATPSILQQPVGFTSISGLASNLVARVAGEPPLSQQWFRNNAPVGGAVTETLSFPNLATANSGDYFLIVSNAFGAATSSVVRVTVHSSLPEWLVLTNNASSLQFTNVDSPFRPDGALKMRSDGQRGLVLLYGRGVERWSDAGERLWATRYVESDFGSLGAMALDRDGNTYVSGVIHFTAEFGGLMMTNNSSVFGPNGHQQAFVAKLDPDGHGLWYRLFEAAGPAIRDLAVAADGDILFVGSHGGLQGRSYLGTISVFEDSYAAAIAGRIGADGTPKWLKSFTQFTVNRSTCEADAVVADGSGIYLSGLISSSIQFGTLQLQGNGHWLGKLSDAGEAVWLKATGGTAQQGDPLALRAGQLWFLLVRDGALQHWSLDGAYLGSVAIGQQPPLSFSLTSGGEPIVLGRSVGPVAVGGTLLNVGNRPLVWFGQWATNGAPVRSRVLATTTNINGFGSDTVQLTAYTAGDNGDVYLAGNFYNAIKLSGRTYTAPAKGYANDFFPGGAYFAKVRQPALLPEITQHPIAEYTLSTGDSVTIGLQASGPGPLNYQWRHDGAPVLDATNNVFKFTNVIVADGGRYDVVVTNPYGTVVSDASIITVRPPFTIRTQPASQLVLLGGTLAGDAIDSLAINPGAIGNKRLIFTITNTTSARFPLNGQFTLNFRGNAAGGSYTLTPDGVFGGRSGSYSTILTLPDYTDFRFLKFNGTDMATLDLSLFGHFDVHFDIAAGDGCCASGTYTISGGSTDAAFTVQTTFFVPDGNYQWQKNGENLPGKTSSRLDLTNVTAADAGFYRCVISYQSYTETSTAAELRLSGAVVPPPVLTLAPLTPGATSFTIPSWPAGFILQRTASLAPADWQTYATLPPVTVSFTQPAAFFRLVTAP